MGRRPPARYDAGACPLATGAREGQCHTGRVLQSSRPRQRPTLRCRAAMLNACKLASSQACGGRQSLTTETAARRTSHASVTGSPAGCQRQINSPAPMGGPVPQPIRGFSTGVSPARSATASWLAFWRSPRRPRAVPTPGAAALSSTRDGTRSPLGVCAHVPQENSRVRRGSRGVGTAAAAGAVGR